MRILVTSGGTREPIDEVRFIGNVSTGRTGAWIVEEALRRYHTVHWLRGEGSVGPDAWMSQVGLLQEESFGSSQDLRDKVLARLDAYCYDAVIHAAAVADYTVARQEGKVPSTLGEWTLTLLPAPKVVDAMVPRLQEASLVVFKLEAVSAQEELLRRGRATLQRTGATLLVANSTSGIGTEGHCAVIADATKVLAEVKHRRELANVLLSLLEEQGKCKQST